jgi:Holliday junction resolvase RusA-like endonuclease
MDPPNRTITFRVYGVPQPGGSKRGFVNPRTGRVIIVEDAKHNKSWRETVLQAAVPFAPKELFRGPIAVRVRFLMPRIKGHYRTGKHAGELKDGAPLFHVVKPDATKLWRSTEDALTGIIWHDDAMIAHQSVTKIYTDDQPGAEIEIQEASESIIAVKALLPSSDLFPSEFS